MATEVSDWIALAALVTSFVAYLEAKKANKTAEAVEALRITIEASKKHKPTSRREQKAAVETGRRSGILLKSGLPLHF